jgi:hypothetical protein
MDARAHRMPSFLTKDKRLGAIALWSARIHPTIKDQNMDTLQDSFGACLNFWQCLLPITAHEEISLGNRHFTVVNQVRLTPLPKSSILLQSIRGQQNMAYPEAKYSNVMGVAELASCELDKYVNVNLTNLISKD